MKTQTLNGTWKYRIGGGEFSQIQVPYSSLAVGRSECVRFFDLQEKSDIILLRFDRITYHAKVFINGESIGEMGPYCEYMFDVTKYVKDKNNELKVVLDDLQAPFGPTAGWENYGGICGNVSLLYKSKTYIENVFFKTKLLDDYKNAIYTLDIALCGEKSSTCCVKLSKNGATVDDFTCNANEKTTQRKLCGIQLWSPDTPVLYDLEVVLLDGSIVVDKYSCKVGFREFSCSSHRFQLNGKDIFLQGVCKHEMQEDYGHAVPYDKVRKEFDRIKSIGCNFVRLVHYPHDKKVLDIADEIGLMVSEEPGLWWSDTANPDIANGSLEVLARTVQRDRNHPSIMFWLCFNECRFTEQFLIDAVKTCRMYDDTRLVSGANCMSLEDTIKYYNLCGFDFYTMHPYSNTFELALKCAKTLVDKPLMFTEWGGCFVYDNPHLLSDFIKGLYDLYLQNSDEGALAGNTFWYWSEINDFTRGKPACVDGALTEALVDRYGNPTMIYTAFIKAWEEVRNPKKYEDLYEFSRVGEKVNKTPLVCKEEKNFDAFIKCDDLSLMPQFYERERMRKTVKGAVLIDNDDNLQDVPFVVSDGVELEFEGTGTDCVSIVGLTSSPKGYPISGEYGEECMCVTIVSKDGKKHNETLKNGVHITTLHTTLSSSRIRPVAEKSVTYAYFSYEKNFENYVINRFDINLPKDFGEIEKVIFRSLDNGYKILIYGVFA